MRTSLFLSVLSTAALGLATDAPETTNNLSASYFAVLPNRVDTEVRGTITIMSPPNGKGADIAITLSGLPSEGGPFLYHIHDKAVPADGNCTGAGAHLDPYGRGETPPCDSSQKQTCQVGDLSGKYGTINATGYSAAPKNGLVARFARNLFKLNTLILSPVTYSYTDHYLSLVPGTPAYFGNRSIVVHFANKTRITCANFITISTGFETPVTPPGFASSTSCASSTPSNSANHTASTSSSAASSPSNPSTTVAESPSGSKSLAVVTGTGAATPAYWVSFGALLGAAFAMVL